ncbi:hypothetical protein [Streptomyces sp. NPDC096351]|uniref:hypothetical protein n=1 Tax=Streptomyces sp. NPDC096351 TaxID=3366087 RepID=UPI00381CB341
MAGNTRRRAARAAGLGAATALVFGLTTGTSFAIENPPTVTISVNFGVVATTHPDTVGCNGYKVTGAGTAGGAPVNGAVWAQDETACTATVPGKYDIKGTATLTESDGDKLYISYELSAPLTSDTMVYPSGTFKILKGEGNFEDSTGGGQMSAKVNLLDHDHASATLTGYIRKYWQV